jgi:hypothetical protein
MKAINQKNQTLVNKTVKLLVKYNELNDQRDTIENNDGEESSAWRRINNKCEIAFDRYEDCCFDLPSREVKEIEKSDLW